MGNLLPPAPSALTWWIVVAVGALTLVAGQAQGFSLQHGSLTNFLVVLVMSLSVVCFYAVVGRPQPQIAILSAIIAFLIFKVLVFAPLSYIAASLNLPFVDGKLAAADAMLGFDWLALHQFTASHAWLATASKFAYTNTVLFMILAWVVLTWTRQYLRLAQMALAEIIALSAVVVVSALVPGVGAYEHYNISSDALGFIGPGYGTSYLADLHAVRDGTLRVIVFGQMRGICTFPSFHTVMALLGAWALWPMRWYLRWPSAIFSAFVLFTTLPIGGHYFVDVLAGAAVFTASIAIAKRLPGTRALAEFAAFNPAVSTTPGMRDRVVAPTMPLATPVFKWFVSLPWSLKAGSTAWLNPK